MNYDEERQQNIEIGQSINIATSIIISKSDKLKNVDEIIKLLPIVAKKVYGEMIKVRQSIKKEYNTVKIPID